MLKQIVLGIALLAGLQGGTAWADEALNKALFDAAKAGDMAKAEALILKGADVNARDKYDRTPLHLAIHEGKKEIAELLIAKGAVVDAKAKFGDTPLHGAGNKVVAELLIAKGASVDAKDESGYTPLHRAGNKDVAELLIAKGATVDAKNNDSETPLHIAAYLGKKEIAEFLIAKGAAVDAKDKSGYTPLHLAIHEGKKEIAELLIAKGAVVDAKDNFGDTLLHWASSEGNKEMAEFLIAKGAAVDAKDKYGFTPLHKAIEWGRKNKKEMAELLIAKGADVYAKNDSGWDLLHAAENLSDQKIRQEIIAMLQGQMAKSTPQQKLNSLLNSLLDRFMPDYSENDELRKSIIQVALKMRPAPAIPQEAEEAAGRAAYIFKNAKSEDDMLATAKEFLKAVEAAPWVANYYYNLCTVLEKTPYTQQALHACKLYLEAAPDAADAADMRQRIAGLKFAVEKKKEQIKQRTKYIGSGEIDDLYRFGGMTGRVADKDTAIKLTVDWQSSPPKYKVFTACILEGDDVKGDVYDLVSTDSWVTFCKTSFHLVIKPEGEGFVELGGGGSLRATLDELFQRKQKALEQSPIFKDYGYGNDKGMRFYVTYLQGGRDNNYAGYAMYESDCNGNPLRKDPRALPDDFFSLEAKKKEGGMGRFHALTDYQDKPQSGCNDRFQSKTGYKFGENE